MFLIDFYLIENDAPVLMDGFFRGASGYYPWSPIFISYTVDIMHNLKNSLVVYVDDATLYEPINSLIDRVSTASSLNTEQGYCYS